jgi:hypothetical protein
VKLFGQTVQCQGFIQMLLDEPADRLHSVGFRVSRKSLGTATQTGPIPGMLGCGRRGEELHILPPWPSRCTRWPAIYPRRRDGKEELSVTARVARQDGIPAGIVQCGRYLGRPIGLMCRHGFSGVHCEYGIRGHSKERVLLPQETDYPNLAVKPILALSPIEIVPIC